jgi:hypothetical protein
MIKIEDNVIHLTRGDATGTDYNVLAIQFPLSDGSLYTFKVGDKIRMTVFDKKGYTRRPILSKEWTVAAATTTPELPLTSTDTKKFEQSNKKITYWYDIVLNDTTTLLGLDDEGAKKMIVYPESEED